jgi:hypothetical protein
MTGDTKEAPLWGHRGSRWVRSAVTFGPVGRIVASLLTLLPLWWFLVYAPFGAIVIVPIWLVKILPWALRDIWRPVKLPANDADLIRAQHELLGQAESVPTKPSISERPTPARW